MTTCEWFNSRLEAYFCDDLSGGDLQRFQAHMQSCGACRHEVDSLKEIDPLMRGVLQHRLALDQTPIRTNGQPRVLKFALAGATLVAALFLVVLGLTYLPGTPETSVVLQPAAVEDTAQPVKKDDTPQVINLSKPLDGPPVKPVPQPHLDTPLANGPEFAITDAAGYTATLDNYRGRVLVFGVVSPEQTAAVANLDQIYEAFGSNPKVGIFAVARHREDDFRGTKFPLFFNNGSRLLGAQEGQFIVVDASGKTRLHDSLADAGSIARIKAELSELGIR